MIPGGAGPVAYEEDAPGDTRAADVHFTDRDGRPWFLYRAREGWIRKHGDTTGYPPANHLAGTGILKPLDLPRSEFMDFQPWYKRMIESDILAGRRGHAGKSSENYDVGLFLPYWERPKQRVYEEDPAARMLGWLALGTMVGVALPASFLSCGMALPLWWLAMKKAIVVATISAGTMHIGAGIQEMSEPGSGEHTVGRVTELVGQIGLGVAAGMALLGPGLAATPALGLAFLPLMPLGVNYGGQRLGEGIYGVDIQTGLPLSDADRWVRGAEGALVLGMTFYGAYKGARAVGRGIETWRANRWVVRQTRPGGLLERGLPGEPGVPTAKRVTEYQMRALMAKYEPEFLLESWGAPASKGEIYVLKSGTKTSVLPTYRKNVELIYHTHPQGTAHASSRDMRVLAALEKLGSAQRVSRIIPKGKPIFRFTKSKRAF